MTAIPILRTERHWTCPNCDLTAVTNRADVHTQVHQCAGLSGLVAPMLEVGTHAKVEAVLRDDYIGDEIVTLDANGRPVMSVVTTRDDGNDVQVFAPTASLTINASER